MEKKIIIQPLALVRNVPLIVNKLDFPEVDITRGALGSLNWSVRSFLAQSGIEIKFHHSNVTTDMIRDINDGIIGVAIPVDIQNHGQRAVELEGGVMRFFWVNDYNRLRGEKLHQALELELNIDGVEGVDWSFENACWDDEELKRINPGQQQDVCIKVNLIDTKFYIPPSSEPVKIKSRTELPSVLQEIPNGLELQFKIGETPKVQLSKNIIAVINLGAYDGGKKHIQSPLIDAGTKGTIRTEIIGNLNWIELFLYRK